MQPYGVLLHALLAILLVLAAGKPQEMEATESLRLFDDLVDTQRTDLQFIHSVHQGSEKISRTLLQQYDSVFLYTWKPGFVDWTRQVTGVCLPLLSRFRPKKILMFLQHPILSQFPELAEVFEWSRHQHLFEDLLESTDWNGVWKYWGKSHDWVRAATGQPKYQSFYAFHFLHVFTPPSELLTSIGQLLPSPDDRIDSGEVTVGVHVRLKWMDLRKNVLSSQDVLDCMLSTEGYFKTEHLGKPVRYFLAADSTELVKDWSRIFVEKSDALAGDRPSVTLITQENVERIHSAQGARAGDSRLGDVLFDFYALALNSDYYIGTGGTWDEWIPFIGRSKESVILDKGRQPWCKTSGVSVKSSYKHLG